jgi:hypothetical protein
MTDISRLEQKVDILTAAINKLVLVEERQSVQSLAIASLTTRVTILEQKLDMWINRGIGAWAVAATLFTFYKTFFNIA